MAKIEVHRVKKDNAVINYFKETRAELRKVNWPSQQEARTLTFVVLSVTVSMAALLGLFDFVFDRLLNGIVNINLLAMVLTVLIVASMFAAGIILSRQE